MHGMLPDRMSHMGIPCILSPQCIQGRELSKKQSGFAMILEELPARTWAWPEQHQQWLVSIMQT